MKDNSDVQQGENRKSFKLLILVDKRLLLMGYYDTQPIGCFLLLGLMEPLFMALSKKQLDELKQLLLDEKQRIVDQLVKRQDVSQSEMGDISGDSADIASLEISQAALHLSLIHI